MTPDSPPVEAADSPRIVFFDVDGTLIEHGEDVAPGTREAVRRMRENGNLAFLCTGRAYSGVPRSVLDIGFDGAITNGGCTVAVANRVVHERTMTLAEAELLLSYFERNDLRYIAQSSGPSYAGPGFLDAVREYEKAMLAEGTDPGTLWLAKWVSNFQPIEDADLETLTKAVFNSPDPLAVEKARDALSQWFHVVPGSLRTSIGTSGEVAPLGSDKGSAIEIVLRHLGMNADQSVGIGDSHNDFEMFEVCGTAVAMGNAEPALKELADLVTTDVQNDGVSNALKMLDLV